MLKKVPLLFFLSLLSTQVIAENIWFTGEVKNIYPQGDGNKFVITFKNDSPHCLSSSRPKYHYAVIGQNGVTEKGLKMLFSAALAGASANKKVTINFDTSTKNCYINRLHVTY